MQVPPPETDQDNLPNCPAVFILWPQEGPPYLSRTALLRRRLLRLRVAAARLEYWRTASSLEVSLLQYELARRHFPAEYLKRLKLRMPPYVKVILSNRFPRTQITTRLTAAPALYYGPFRSRQSAERFESQFLDLFQIRRCQENLNPSPQHPGCMYGEMNLCLRPCQQVVGVQEYQSEVHRVTEFLSTDGRSLVESVSAARDRLSEEMNFEEAARQHKRLEKVQQVLKLRDDLVRDIDRLNGVAVAPSIAANSVELWFVLAGTWQDPRRFTFEVVEGKPVSMDQKLKELVAGLAPGKSPWIVRQEHLALLARWYYSSWRTGEWVPFESLGQVPYRKLVNAIHRVATPEPVRHV